MAIGFSPWTVVGIPAGDRAPTRAVEGTIYVCHHCGTRGALGWAAWRPTDPLWYRWWSAAPPDPVVLVPELEKLLITGCGDVRVSIPVLQGEIQV